MIAALLSRFIGQKAATVIADLLPFIVVAGLVWWVAGMRSTIAEQRVEIATVKRDLATEQAARLRDVAALTTLNSGLVQVAADTKRDQSILAETVTDAKAPSSPQLARLFDELRKADAAKPANAATSTGR